MLQDGKGLQQLVSEGSTVPAGIRSRFCRGGLKDKEQGQQLLQPCRTAGTDRVQTTPPSSGWTRLAWAKWRWTGRASDLKPHLWFSASPNSSTRDWIRNSRFYRSVHFPRFPIGALPSRSSSRSSDAFPNAFRYKTSLP